MGPFPARAPKLFFHLLSDILPGSVAWLLIDDMIKVAAASFPASQPRCKEDAGLPRPAAESMARRQLHGVVFFNGTGGGRGGGVRKTARPSVLRRDSEAAGAAGKY